MSCLGGELWSKKPSSGKHDSSESKVCGWTWFFGQRWIPMRTAVSCYKQQIRDHDCTFSLTALRSVPISASRYRRTWGRLENLVDLWAQHILKHYKHAVRYFGLFAPRSVNRMFDRIFSSIGCKRRPHPAPPHWAESLKQMTGRDPLLDSTGQQMRWVRHLKPQIA
jgi:hypothetical protein